MENKSKPWSSHDIAILAKYFPYDNLQDVSEILGRSVKSIRTKASKEGIERYVNKDKNMSYILRLVRAKDGMVFYEKYIPCNYDAMRHKNVQIREWRKQHYNKLVTGEWQLSIINGFENY